VSGGALGAKSAIGGLRLGSVMGGHHATRAEFETKNGTSMVV
jgi:hypothetical protein